MFYEDEEEKRRQMTAQYVDTPYGLVRNPEQGQKGIRNKEPVLRDGKTNLLGKGCENYLQAVPENKLGKSPQDQIAGTIRDYCKNYIDMRNANLRSSEQEKALEQTADNYYHCKANFDAAKRGNWGYMASNIIGNAREALDYFSNRFIKNKSMPEAINDYWNDINVNENSRNNGLKNRNILSEEACWPYKPDKLDEEEEYRKWYR